MSAIKVNGTRKITDLTAATTINDADALMVETSSGSRKVTGATLKELINDGVVDGIEVIAPEFDSTLNYSTGDYVYSEGKLYRFTADHATGALDGSDTVEVTVGSELENKVNSTDYATSSDAGVVKTGYGVKTNSEGVLTTDKAILSYIKQGGNGYNPIVPDVQHHAVFYGLAKAAGDSTQSVSSNATGTYTDDAKSAIQSMLDVPSNDAVVTDVQINGTTIVSDGVAEIPVASTSDFGAVKIGSGIGISITNNGTLALEMATTNQIKAGTERYKAIVPNNQSASIFYGLAKAAGDTTQSASSNAVGTYTTEAKAAICSMLGVDSVQTVTVSGTDVTINGVANTAYQCGEVTSITITPPNTGIIDVTFTSGSTVAVLSLPSTVKMPEWFDTTDLESNTFYEINISDGIYGTVMSWAI